MRDRRGHALERSLSARRPLRGWRFEPRSLSRSLARACSGRFEIRVLVQGLCRPLPAEKRTLGLASRSRVFGREVLMLCDDEAWVFARSVFPLAALRGPRRRLTRLDGRPLGTVLFSLAGVNELRAIERPRGDPDLLQRCKQILGGTPSTAHVRCRRFICDGHTLLVREVFLSASAALELGRDPRTARRVRPRSGPA